MFGAIEKVLTGEARKAVTALGKCAESGSVAKAIERQAASAVKDVRISAEIGDFARHFRLDESPKLVQQLARLDDFWGRDVTRGIARDHLGHRGGFVVDLVENAERRGYQDLKGLQEAIPAHWLSRAPCPFCHPDEILKPAGSIVGESENFVAAPNLRQLFALEGEEGGHMMVFAKHHRSTPAGLPDQYRKELVETVRKTKQAMQEAYGKPVSIFANGEPGAPIWALEDVDTHAHMQLFSGDATVTDLVVKEAHIPPENVIPVNGFDDYFRLYDAGKLRQRYVLTLDASEKGAVILVGDRRTEAGLAMRNVRVKLGLPYLPKIDPDPGKAGKVTALVKPKARPLFDALAVRAVLAGAPVQVK